MPTPKPVPPGLFGWIDQSPTLATIVGGLAVALLLALLSRVPKLKPGYAVVGRFFRRAWAHRPVLDTRARKVAAVKAAADAGYAQRDEEVREERRRSLPPSWRIDTKGLFNEEGDIFWLNNRGHGVQDVRLTAEPELFAFKAEAYWPGGWENGTGKFFEGEPTKKGRAEGVPFHVEWVDQVGDTQHSPEPVMLTPEEMVPKPTQTREEAREAGRLQGRAEVQAEVDAARAVPRLEPVWAVTRVQKGNPTTYTLMNYAEGTVATNVILSAPVEEFSPRSTSRWDNIHGHDSKNFQGIEVRRSKGVHFSVEWTDESGDRKTAPTFLDKPPPTMTVF